MSTQLKSSTAPARRSQTDEAYQRLRLEILTFGLKPGETTSEVQISERFGLPLGAVRAAMPRLRSERLLINKGRLGQMIAPISLYDIRCTWELRLVLEPVAARKAVPHLDVAELRKAEELVVGETPPGCREAEIASMFASRDFHMLIAEKSGNSTLCEYIRQLQDNMIRFQYLLRHSERGSREWDHGHSDLIMAFERSDPEAASVAMHNHIEKGRELMIKATLDLAELQNVNIGAVSTD